jgi:GNAT superfamily N-acetyltransferase
MGEIVVRKTKNLDLINRLDKKTFHADAEPSEVVTAWHTWFIAIVDDKIAGFAGLEEGEGGYGYLKRAGVLKEFRGKGVQRALIRARDKEAKRKGWGRNITYTADWNLSSANNLMREGYLMYSPQWRYGLKHALYFYKVIKRKDNV